MENKKLNILFVCGMGMGTSTMAELGVRKNISAFGIAADVQHTSLGQMDSLRDWADVIVILKNLYNQVTPGKDEHFIPVVNIMDSKGICAKINEVAEEFYPEVKG